MSRSPDSSNRKKSVNLRELELSGTLSPSIPVQICLKYNPPTITVVYHFANKSDEEFFHNIPFERSTLENESTEQIVDYLYVAEGYYFNPKILKRQQVKRLVQKFKNYFQAKSWEQLPGQFQNFADHDKSPERHSIQPQMSGSSQGSGSPIRGRDMQRGSSAGAQGMYAMGNIDRIPNVGGKRQHHRNNGSPPQQMPINENQMPNLENLKPTAQNQQQSNFQQMQQNKASQRRRDLFNKRGLNGKRRFLDYQAHNPADFQNLTDPPESNLLGGNKNQMPGKKTLPPLETPDARSSLLNHGKQNMNPKKQRQLAMQDRMPIDGNSPAGIPAHHNLGQMQPTVPPNVSNQSSVSNNNKLGFSANSPVQANHGMRGNNYEDGFQNQASPYQNQGISGGGQELMADNDDSNSQQQQYANDQSDMQSQPQDPNASTQEEHVSVYMKDNNVLMRRIQIEGDEREFLMDPDGNIFDMQGTFIGTANTNELEELNEGDSQNQQQTHGESDQIQGNSDTINEMMLLEDDDNDENPAPGMQQQVGRYSQNAEGGKMDFDYGSQDAYGQNRQFVQ